jgi:HEAT repeat protein
VDPLIQMLKSEPNGDARSQAASALGAIGDARAADALTAALNDKEPDVRREAAMALARLADGH